MKVNLKYRSHLQVFSVNAELIERCKLSKEHLYIGLDSGDYYTLGCAKPKTNAPTIGFLMGKALNDYEADFDTVTALAKTGVKIRFLVEPAPLKGCDGLLLPNVLPVIPQCFLANFKNASFDMSHEQSACLSYLDQALELDIPVLAIGNGAQMVAGAFGLKFYRGTTKVETPINHLSDMPDAHRLNIFEGSVLQQLFNGKNLFFVNSEHRRIMVPQRVQKELWEKVHPNEPLPLEFYAEANDGIPEAWGSKDKKLLCTQWDPAVCLANGNTSMQAIFDWLRQQTKV
jgi:gamma-glutamyl-gamma-aminobutyrate hydrolase PuuD